MEERLARIESHVEHLQSDLTDVQAGLMRLDAKIDAVDQRLSARLDKVTDSVTTLAVQMERGFAAVNAAIAALALTTERSFTRQTRWGSGLAASLVAVMAHGFKWL